MFLFYAQTHCKTFKTLTKCSKYNGYSYVNILILNNYFANPHGMLECYQLHNNIQHSI